jgi:hypothetical protein
MIAKITFTRPYLFFVIGCLCCFFWAGLLPTARGAKLSENEILAMGTATVKGGNMAQAKETAVSNALMKGLENYLLQRLGSEGIVNNFQRIIHEIIPNAKDKIENFNILAEDQMGEEYRVLVRLRINEKVINKKLREADVVVAEGAPIKVLFLVSERQGRTVYYWWKDPEMHSSLSRTELSLYNVFQERGLSPINRTISIPDTDSSEFLKYANLRDVDALEWGRLFSADVVIYGQTEIVNEKEASLTLKALDVNQSTQISEAIAFEQVERGANGKRQTIQAIERLVNRLAVRLTPSIVRFTASDRGRVRHIEITLQGLSSYKQFRMFRDFLRRDVEGVKSVRQTKVRKDSISIAVEFQGDKNRFVERVTSHENLPFLLRLDHDEGERILLKIL